jgi:hypothetical protein
VTPIDARVVPHSSANAETNSPPVARVVAGLKTTERIVRASRDEFIRSARQYRRGKKLILTIYG